LIQKTRHLDSIVARALLVADFIDGIDPQRTSPDLELELRAWALVSCQIP
jgi:hypothetical protein